MAKKMKQGRIYRGIAPARAVLLDSNDEWSVYETTSIGIYVNVKVVAHNPRAKANFYLGFNKQTMVLTKTKDSKILTTHYPLLCEWVINVLRAKAGTGVIHHL